MGGAAQGDGGGPKKNKGILKLGATVADQMTEYPTDLKLLNQARLESERIIGTLYRKPDRMVKPRAYRRIARGKYTVLAKMRRKGRPSIRIGIRQQLGYACRNLGTVEELLDGLPGQSPP